MGEEHKKLKELEIEVYKLSIINSLSQYTESAKLYLIPHGNLKGARKLLVDMENNLSLLYMSENNGKKEAYDFTRKYISDTLNMIDNTPNEIPKIYKRLEKLEIITMLFNSYFKIQDTREFIKQLKTVVQKGD